MHPKSKEHRRYSKVSVGCTALAFLWLMLHYIPILVPEFRWRKTFLRQGPGVWHTWRAAVRAGRLPVRASLPGRPHGGRYWEGAGGSSPREEGGRVSSPLRQAACRQQKVMSGFPPCSGSVGPVSFGPPGSGSVIDWFHQPEKIQENLDLYSFVTSL